ncbi:MAG: TetR/AcrR family transcriptional regulator [Myxococcota bacterium]|nr:TetR/AcrR family transcriptional regulator [Myxococcota bacterium]
MENEVLDGESTVAPTVARSVQRSLGPRYSAYLDEVQRLLKAGMEEIVASGSVEPRVADIVRRAGLSNKAFYRHFQSKDELLLAILEENLQARVRDFDDRLAKADSALERARLWVWAVVETALDPQLSSTIRPILVYQARLTETLGEQLYSHRDHLRRPLIEALEDGRSSGELEGVDPERDAVCIQYLALGWMHGAVLERRTPAREEAEHVVEFALRGLKRS